MSDHPTSSAHCKERMGKQPQPTGHRKHLQSRCLPQQLEASFGHKPSLRLFSRNYVNGRGSEYEWQRATRIFPLRGHVLGNIVKRWPQFPSDSSVGRSHPITNPNRILNDVHHFQGKNEVWVLGSEVQRSPNGFLWPPRSCLFGRMLAHSQAGENPFCSHPFCSNVWFSIQISDVSLETTGLKEGWRLWNLPSQEGQANSETRGHPDCLRKRSKQGTQLRWASGVRRDSSSGVFWSSTPLFQVGTKVREEELAHVIQDIPGTELWTLPLRLNNFSALS